MEHLVTGILILCALPNSCKTWSTFHPKRHCTILGCWHSCAKEGLVIQARIHKMLLYWVTIVVCLNMHLTTLVRYILLFNLLQCYKFVMSCLKTGQSSVNYWSRKPLICDKKICCSYSYTSSPPKKKIRQADVLYTDILRAPFLCEEMAVERLVTEPGQSQQLCKKKNNNNPVTLPALCDTGSLAEIVAVKPPL